MFVVSSETMENRQEFGLMVFRVKRWCVGGSTGGGCECLRWLRIKGGRWFWEKGVWKRKGDMGSSKGFLGEEVVDDRLIC